MKDAFGGVFIIRIMLVFFIVFISFMAVAINWAKTFRVKSGVISILEKSSTDVSNEVVKGNVDNYLTSINYAAYYNTSELAAITEDCNRLMAAANIKDNSAPMNSIYGNIGGVCIIPIGDDSNYYYRVYSYYVINAPIFGIHKPISIGGESKTISKKFQ